VAASGAERATQADFEPFQTLDPGRAHYRDGHGLGLSIVRAIAVAHSATITAEPLPDGGVSIEIVFRTPADPVYGMDETALSKRSQTDGAHQG
jgi:K+-sensing histidine kinase KdpD